MRSSFYRNGRLWSREGIRLIAAIVTAGTSETTLATQPSPATAAVVSVASSSDDDGKIGRRLLQSTVTGDPPTDGDVLRLSIDSAHYDHAYAGTESAEDIFAAITATVAAANGGDGDPTFIVDHTTTELHLGAKVLGTAANTSVVTLAWVSSAATAALIEVAPGTDVVAGVRTVHVDFLDANGRERSEVLTLNGTDPVETALHAIWVQRLTVVTAGEDGYAAGDITADIGGHTFVAILAGDVQSQTGGYMVPAHKQLRLACLTAGCESPVRVRVRTNHDGETGITFHTLRHTACDFIGGPNAEDFDFCDGSPSYPSGTVLAVTVAVATKTVVATLLGYLEPEGTIG